MELQTRRLILRDIADKDAKAISRIRSNPNVAKYLGKPYPFSIETAQNWVKYCQEQTQSNPRVFYNFAIDLKEEFIGEIGFAGVLPEEQAYLGFWLAEEYWRKGFMTEALNTSINYMFQNFNLQKIVAEVAEPNILSITLLKKAGFEYDETTSAKTKVLQKMNPCQIQIVKNII